MIITLKNLTLVLSAAAAVEAAAVVYPELDERATSCAADNCFASAIIPPVFRPKVSSFCYKYLRKTPATTTVTSTVAGATTVAGPGTPCAATSTISDFPTKRYFTYRGTAPAPQRRAAATPAPEVLPALVQGCNNAGSLPAKISSACSCFLKGATTATVRTTVTSVSTTTTQACTATTTTKYVFATNVPAPSCGVATPVVGASGSITCAAAAAAQETNARFRIEGGTSEGTIFEDCIASGPKDITTPSGGTHSCDGTNNNANPSPGGTLTTQIDAAGLRDGFDFDGTYSSSFSDFFISRISTTSQTSNQFWGVLRDLTFTSRGGCQEYSSPGEGLWAFDAFAPNRVFLKLNPEYQVVAAGSTVSLTLTVRQADPNSGSLSPASGAAVGGQTSDASGSVQIQVPAEPGCYIYKATRSNSIASNSFYLTVLPASQ